MQLKIGSKDVKLKFGMKFCRELDKVYRVDYQGLEFGMGVNLAFMNLNQSNPVALAEVVKAATAHEGYSTDDIDDAIERYAEKEGDLFSTHSVDEALEVHRAKLRPRRKPVLTKAPGSLHAEDHLDERPPELPEKS